MRRPHPRAIENSGKSALPSWPTPSRMARASMSSVHRPAPVSGSGVIFGATNPEHRTCNRARIPSCRDRGERQATSSRGRNGTGSRRVFPGPGTPHVDDEPTSLQTNDSSRRVRVDQQRVSSRRYRCANRSRSREPESALSQQAAPKSKAIVELTKRCPHTSPRNVSFDIVSVNS
jgi:hypothetical protein